MKRMLTFLVFFLLLPATVWAQVGIFGKSYAVVVGIDNYKSSHWDNLPYPEKDAMGMTQFLASIGFEVKSFYGKNATKHNIIVYLTGLADFLQKKDRFVFFFSGHGETKEFGQKEYGYIIPFDATDKPATWIGMVQLENIADMMNAARHQLFLFDSCFGGMFGLKSSMSGYRPGIPDYIKKISSRKARQYITAGGKDEQVLADGPEGYSYFTGYLLKALRGEANTNSDGYITASELEAYLVPAATNRYHTPSGGTFSGHEQGDFLFKTTKTGMGKEAIDAIDPNSLLKSGRNINPVEAEYKAKKNARVREAPSITSKQIRILKRGQLVWVAGRTATNGDTWYFVNLSDNTTGYVYGTLLGEVDETTHKTVASLSVGDVIPRPVWPSVSSGRSYKWKMVTTWPPNLPLFQENCDRFARLVKEKSNGRLQIQVFAAGELVPAFETFQAVSDGTIECGNSAAYYWAGKEPAVQWFAGIPFGMNSVGMAKWIHGEGGQELWEEVYRPFNLIPRPAGNMGMQMGGWFNKKINTIDDFKGLKMRIPGLGGKVVGEAGGTVVLLPGGEIFTSLERGVIDATEWVGPYLDLRMGFYQAAKFYYYPGWHEPGTMLEFIFNRKAYLSLPPDLQSVIDQCALDCERWSYKETEKRNREAINDLVIEKKVVLMKFPDQVLEGLNRISDNVLYKESLKTGMAKKVYDAYRAAQLKFGESASYLANSYYEELR